MRNAGSKLWTRAGFLCWELLHLNQGRSKDIVCDTKKILYMVLLLPLNPFCGELKKTPNIKSKIKSSQHRTKINNLHKIHSLILHHNYKKNSPWSFYSVIFNTFQYLFCPLLLLVTVLIWKSSWLPHSPGLTWARSQAPTKATLSLLSAAGQWRKNLMKGSCVEVRTCGDHSLNTITDKTGSTSRNKVNLLSTKSDQDNEK